MTELYIVVVGWERFQHKDVWKKSGGRPPWIKNYTALLHDDAYISLTPVQALVLHRLWLVYASASREVPLDTGKLSRWLGVRVTKRTLDALNRAGFIEFSSQPSRESFAPDSPLEESRGERTASRQATSVEDPDAVTPTSLPARNGQPALLNPDLEAELDRIQAAEAERIRAEAEEVGF